MKEVAYAPLEYNLDNITIQLVIWIVICVGSYVIALIILHRLIKVPKKVANFISVTVFLVAMYYSFVNGYIPGIQSTH